MIERARRLTDATGPANVSFERADAAQRVWLDSRAWIVAARRA